MKLRMKSVVAGASALAIAGAGLALATPANAWTGTGQSGAPSWYIDSSGTTIDTARKGQVLFYDASGNQIIGGSNINAVGTVGAAFGYLAVSGGATGAGATRINANIAAPDPTKATTLAPPSTWSTNNVPPLNVAWAGLAGVPSTVSTGHLAWMRLNATGAALQDVASGLVLYSGANAEYKNVLELRVADTVDINNYWAVDIEFNPTSATANYDGLAPGAWKVIYPNQAQTTTLSAVSSSAGLSYNVGGTTNLSATVTPTGAAGTVQFLDNGAAVGAPVTVSAGSATLNAVTLAGSGTPGTPANHTLTASFTPAAFTPFSAAASTTPNTVVTVNTPAQNTTTNLSLGAATVISGNSVSATATVTWNAGASSVGNVGQVQFIVDGTNSGSPVSVSGGQAVLNINSTGLTPGNHSVVASYTDSTSFNPSSSSGATFAVTAASFDSDVQAIETGINPGTITISTPYDGNATKATYCAVDQALGSGGHPANPATFGKVVWTATGVSHGVFPFPSGTNGVAAVSPATTVPVAPVLAAALPNWPGSTTQQNTTACGFLFVPALSLDGTASLYSASATFDGISVTDTRPGTNPYTLNALSSNMTKQGLSGPAGNDEIINAQNIGLTALALDSTNVLAPFNTFIGAQTPGAPGTPGVGAATGQNYTAYDNLAAAGVSSAAAGSAGLGGATGHQVLHANRGLGTIVTHGTVGINAPTNTRDGVYASTITFTVLGS